MRQVHHRPVMVREVLSALDVRSGGSYVDCTVGEGGHAQAVLSTAEPPPRLLGIDLDDEALSTAAERLGPYRRSVKLVKGSYADLERLAGANGFVPADGVLFDFGLSSLQLESRERGFSFSRDGALDMRFDREQSLSAGELVNGTQENELADIIYKYGEEPKSRRVARAIVAARPIGNAVELAGIVEKAAGRRGQRGIHPATRTFQALRIAVNRELDNVRDGLEQAVQVLGDGGRLVAISYHSLEDRIVKVYLKQESTDCICPPETLECVCGHKASIRLVRRRVVKPSAEEIQENPRSRSARLRVAERL